MVRQEAIQCVHRWVLSDPHRGSVRGLCRRCGASRNYPSGLQPPETVPDYDELADGPPGLAVEAIPAEEHVLV